VPPDAAAWKSEAAPRALTRERRRMLSKLDDLGHRLPQHRARVEGAPKLARPSSNRWAAADRWLEAGP
jgi:hypothetical protein